MLYVAQIVDGNTDEIVRSSAPTDLRRAEKIEDGMNINLNHERFFTRVIAFEGVS
jgi:hypothetical protein